MYEVKEERLLSMCLWRCVDGDSGSPYIGMNRENERANGGEFIEESEGFPVMLFFSSKPIS